MVNTKLSAMSSLFISSSPHTKLIMFCSVLLCKACSPKKARYVSRAEVGCLANRLYCAGSRCIYQRLG